MLPKKHVININSGLVKTGHIYNQVLLILLAGSGSLMYGFQSGWISPMKKILLSASSPSGIPLTEGEMTWVASTMTLTAIFTVPIHIFTADTYGRKAGLVLTFMCQALSWIILLISSRAIPIILARVFTGIGGAGSFTVIYIYVKEICQDSIRGTLVIFSGSFQFLGVLGVYLMGSYLHYYTTIWVCLCISVITIILLIAVAPETPAYSVKRGKVDIATVTLATLRGYNVDDIAVQNEMDDIKSQDQYFKKFGNITYLTIFKNKAWRKGTILCFLMYLFVGFNGTFCILTYAHGIIAQWGVDISPELQSLSVPIMMVFGCIIPMSCLERTGRKALAMGTFMLSAAALIVLGTSFLLKDYGIIFPWYVPVMAMAITVCAYSMGVISIPAVIVNDMFRFEVRAKISGCVITAAWIGMSLQVASYDAIVNCMGPQGAFYIFAAVNICNTLLLGFFMPETKGKTAGEIEDLLLGKKTAPDVIP